MKSDAIYRAQSWLRAFCIYALLQIDTFAQLSDKNCQTHFRIDFLANLCS